MANKENIIFISYRRQDSAYAAGRLFDHLSQHFGADRLFMDIDTIELGIDFVQRIQSAVEACDVLIAVIGKQWLSATDDTGELRLDNPNDYVRLEISTALLRNIHVIPVLIDGATMPKVNELPKDLEQLPRRNGIEISHSRFQSDTKRLIDGIDAIFETTKTEKMDANVSNDDISWQGISCLSDGRKFITDSCILIDLNYVKINANPENEIQPQHVERVLNWETSFSFRLDELKKSEGEENFWAPGKILINGKYINFLLSLSIHNELEFYANSPKEPLIFRVDKKIIGAVMPMDVKN